MLESKSRREFLKFIGQSSIGIGALTLPLSSLVGCANFNKSNAANFWKPLLPSTEDKLLLAGDLNYYLMASWRDVISVNDNKKSYYGMNNDFTSYIPFDSARPNEGYLLVNHESVNSLFASGWHEKQLKPKTKEQVDIEMSEVGVSLLHIKKNHDGNWKIVENSKINKRLDANTPIPFSLGHNINGQNYAVGTLANCAGGQTPWKSFLTCEENYDQFYGEWLYKSTNKKNKSKSRVTQFSSKDLGWSNYYNHTPWHYGWVVEINPATDQAKKLTALGRFAHEGATCVQAKDGRTVVYMGDDAVNECIYKFISSKPHSLDEGILYVADTDKGVWIPLDVKSNSLLKRKFKTQLELLIHTRIAAHLAGGTPQDRPEDIEVNPVNNEIIVALTNNIPASRPHGSLLKIIEKNSDFLSLEFTTAKWISGGDKNILSCPDNLIFDRSGNLWVTTDRSNSKATSSEYQHYKNNGLYYIPAKGEFAGEVFQVASAPRDAEFTGPTFLPDGTLLLCVQSPGDSTENIEQPTSHWPDNSKIPKSSLVAIRGSLLNKLTS